MDAKPYLETTGRALLGSVPTIGTALNEIVFEHASRLKQRRFEEFVRGISTKLEAVESSAVDREYLQSDEFIDFFESVLNKVTRTSSREKLERLKKAFAGQIQAPIQTDYQNTFLDLIMNVSEQQIIIMKAHIRHKGLMSQDDYLEAFGKQRTDEDKGFRLAEFRTGQFYGISRDDYRYLVQDIIAKCLLVDDGMGRMGIRPLQVLEITELGEHFIAFIKEAEE